MANLSESEINDMLRAYIKTPAGKRKVAKHVDDVVAGKTGSKDTKGAVTKDKMKEAAELLRESVVQAAMEDAKHNEAYSQDGIPYSIIDLIDTLTYSNPKKRSNGIYEVTFHFGGNLYRPSLEPEKYHGIDNIVALFNNGYVSPNSKYVNGMWHNEMHFGLPYREGHHFIERGVTEYNWNFGDAYNSIAKYNTGIYH